MSYILDSSALLANIWGEPGAAIVADHLQGAQMSAVNFAEVASKLAERGIEKEKWKSLIIGFGIKIIDFDQPQAIGVGLLRASTKTAGLSLGDRACLTLAQAKKLPVLTADKIWAELGLGLEIKLVR
ncbi:MAG TPA: type II toxin-antitoxin system VapC family toxin [Aestuariivirga sp.]